MIDLGGVSYKTKKQAISDVKRILNETEPGTILEDIDFDIVLGALECHPQASEKIGEGVLGIMVDLQEAPPHPRVFRVIRVDGTRTTFSYVKCFVKSLSSQKALVLNAMRHDVKEQIINVKSWYYEVEAEDGRCFSPQDNKWLLPSESALDHYPISFSTIANQFVEKHFDGNWELIPVKKSDADFGQTIDNPSIQSLWRSWHESQAQYRIISQGLNSRLGKHDRKVS